MTGPTRSEPVGPAADSAPSLRWPALGLALGPVAFVTGWVVGGGAMPDPYSPIHDAISRIAAVGSPQQATMTVAFVVYGVALMVGAVALRGTVLSRCWPLALVNGAATIAVAATPLDHSSTVDLLHGLSATVGYLTISALPLVAAPILRRQGFGRAAALSVAAGVASGVCLVATTSVEATGLFQRAGLLSGDAWLVATGVAAARHQLAAR